MTQVSLRATSAEQVKADVLVVGTLARHATSDSYARGGTGRARPRRGTGRGEASRGGSSTRPCEVLGVPGVLAAVPDLPATLAALGHTGAAGEATRLPVSGLGAPVVLAVGVATLEDREVTVEELRRAAGVAGRALRGVGSAAVALPVDTVERLTAVAEGLLLGAYTYTRYKSDAGKPPVARVVLAGAPDARGATARSALDRARVVAEAVGRTRDWVNTPPADLTPAAFADAARDAAGQASDVEVEVLDERALRRGGYGGILGVGRGSTHPPRLVRLAYRHPGASTHLALVGKGITFDSGGLSIKTADGMVTMKCDMAGAAAVLSAVLAVARLGLALDVTAYAAMAENMPSGTATRPSDVLTMYGGKTVEVLNTDAEGRLVLGDALVRAGEDAPDVMVDVATLTGACIIALGTRVGGIFSPDQDLADRIQAAASAAGELMWPLPLTEETREKIDSPIADLQNMGDKYGGAITAAVFLQQFVPPGVPWAHLDIAGPAFHQGAPYGYTVPGGTGAAVRTLVRLAEDLAATPPSRRDDGPAPAAG